MNTYWINCDIYGTGRRWRLAVERDGQEVYFPLEDFGEEMTIDEYREEFPDNTVKAVSTPGDARSAGQVLIEEIGAEGPEGVTDTATPAAKVIRPVRGLYLDACDQCDSMADQALLAAKLIRWGASATHAMSKVAPDATRFEALWDEWDEMEQRSGHTIRAILGGELPEPCEHIADVHCPCCGERIRIQHGKTRAR